MAGRGERGRGRAGTAAPRPLGLFGHRAARERVQAALELGRLAPVLLVTGLRGVGKETFGFWVARRLLCRAAGERPCDACPDCARIFALQHPDVHWFFPVPAESAFGEAEWGRLLEQIRADPLNPAHTRFTQPASFRMHQAAAIRRLVATKPFEGGERVFVLGDYEQNPSDQVHNALLKLFEEPPPRTTFVLTASRWQSLPPTIVSRCTPVRLGPLSPGEMEAFLAAVLERHEAEAADLAEARRREVLALAEGRPGRALELLRSSDRAGEDALEMLCAAVEGGPSASYAWALTTSLRGSREEHNRRLDALAGLWRDLLRVRAGEGAPARPDLLELYRRAAERLDPAAGAAAALEIERGREQVQANVYVPLVFWRLFRTLALAFEGQPREAREGRARPAGSRA